MLLHEGVRGGRASMTVIHRRLTLDGYVIVGEPETVWNLITNAGRIALHTQGYGISGLLANGFNYIALSDTIATSDPTATTLAGEIVSSGLSRVQGLVTLPTGSANQTTISNVFTAIGGVSAKTAALFTAPSGGTMNHVLGFTERSLISGDTLQVTFTITLG